MRLYEQRGCLAPDRSPWCDRPSTFSLNRLPALQGPLLPFLATRGLTVFYRVSGMEKAARPQGDGPPAE